ncbi:MAG: GIY-YIG nuclease family protein [Saprospiraceae bacterium]
MDEDKYLNNLYQRLLEQRKIKIDASKIWLQEIRKTAGVYLIRINGEVKYVGETGNIYKRMNDLLKTYNHTFRRSLGKYLYSDSMDYNKANSKRKFSERIERKLDDYMRENCEVSFLEVKLGRKELEELVQERYGDKLLNMRSKRK